MEEKRITKKEKLEMLKEIVIASDAENTDVLVDFLEQEIMSAEKRAEKAKERAEKKKAEGDELRTVVKSVLTNEYQTVDEIFGQIEGEDLSKAKIIARLTQLVNYDEAEKADVKVGDRRVKGYRLITEDAE